MIESDFAAEATNLLRAMMNELLDIIMETGLREGILSRKGADKLRSVTLEKLGAAE